MEKHEREMSFSDYFREELSMTRSGWGAEVDKKLQDAKEKVLKEIEKNYEEGEYDIGEIYTASELEDYWLEMVEADLGDKLAQKYSSYIDVPHMLQDEYFNGTLAYYDVLPEGAEHTIRYFFFPH